MSFQTFDGWEATAWLMDRPEPDLVRQLPAFYDQVVDAGVNRVRLEIRSGTEGGHGTWGRYVRGEASEAAYNAARYPTRNDNADSQVIDWSGFDFGELDQRIEQGVLPLRTRLAARGERLFVNLCYVSFMNRAPPGSPYIHGDPEEYAEFVLAAYIHIHDKYGFVPDALEVMLEPDNESPTWSGAVMGRAMAATAARLSAHGFNPRFIAPSVTDMRHAPAYIEAIAAEPAAMSHLDEIAYHRYGGDVGDLRRIVDMARRYGKKTAMLELWFGKATPDVLYEDLTTGMNSAWQGETIRGVGYDETPGAKPAVRMTTDIAQKAQVFRYVRAGAVRIAADSNWSRIKAMAFRDSRRGVAVILAASRRGAVRLAGLPAGRYAMSSVDDGGRSRREPERLAAAGQVLEIVVPAPGVYTVFDARLERPTL